MKLVKSASGKTTIRMSRQEWTDMGKKAGWINKEAQPIAGTWDGQSSDPSSAVKRLKGEIGRQLSLLERVLRSIDENPRGAGQTGVAVYEVLNRYDGFPMSVHSGVEFLVSNTPLYGLSTRGQALMDNPNDPQTKADFVQHAEYVLKNMGSL